MDKETLKLNAKLHQKIEAISHEIGYQEKKGTNTHSRYNFTSNEQMMAAVRMALVKHKLSLTCDIVDYEERETQTAAGKQVVRSIVRIEVTITDTETGHSVKSKGIGAEQDTQGKSMQQAVTQAFKYWIFKNFKVSSIMEKDPDANTTTAAPATPSQPEILARLAKCKTTACIKKMFDSYGHLPGIKEACTKQKNFINQNKK